jgi:hypothetical protein
VDSVSKLFLGVVALATLVQALAMVVFAWAGFKLFREIAELRARLGEPVAGEVHRFVRNMADVSATLKAQGDRVENAVGTTTATLHETADYLGRAVRAGARPLVEIGALWQAVKRGIGVYRSLGPAPRIAAAPPTSLPDVAGPHEEWGERHKGFTEH